MATIVYAIDIGTTNVKAALYDESLRLISAASEPVIYARSGGIVEFDPEVLFGQVIDLIGRCARASTLDLSSSNAVLAITGQAESLVMTDRFDRPTRPGISWLDNRSTTDAAEIAGAFNPDESFRITGQPVVTSTWPATKLRWLRRHEPDILRASTHVYMVKDYIQARLTGERVGELSTRAFSYLFDVNTADYWDPMLDFCGVDRGQLPTLVRPGLDIGPVMPALTEQLPPARGYVVNVGLLDHFAGMIGTGSYRRGAITESAGTVLSLSMLFDDYASTISRPLASYHRGAHGDDYVLFDACDSGGVCFDWYLGLSGLAVPERGLDRRLVERTFDTAPIFLPYLTGVNAPDYNPDARGAFLDLTLDHDELDLAYAVMEGVAHLLRRNLEHCVDVASIDALISSGGGNRSDYWTQLKADVCGCRILAPSETEAVCRGAAVVGLVEAGVIDSIAEADGLAQAAMRAFQPRIRQGGDLRYERYLESVERLYGMPSILRGDS